MKLNACLIAFPLFLSNAPSLCFEAKEKQFKHATIIISPNKDIP